jgi:F420H(2)-dependent quinone reductase
MSDPIVEASTSGWIADHRKNYLADGEAAHLWDSTMGGGPGPLPTLLLFTTGAKSGNESIMPLLYGDVDGGKYAIIASKGGDPKHPGWYHNIKKQGDVKVKVRNDEFKASTRVATGDERARIWDQMAAMYPPFNDYKASADKATGREIPVIVLEPVR